MSWISCLPCCVSKKKAGRKTWSDDRFSNLTGITPGNAPYHDTYDLYKFPSAFRFLQVRRSKSSVISYVPNMGLAEFGFFFVSSVSTIILCLNSVAMAASLNGVASCQISHRLGVDDLWIGASFELGWH